MGASLDLPLEELLRDSPQSKSEGQALRAAKASDFRPGAWLWAKSRAQFKENTLKRLFLPPLKPFRDPWSHSTTRRYLVPTNLHAMCFPYTS